MIFAMAKYTHGLAVVHDLLGKFLAGYVDRKVVVLRQARDVARFGFDVVIAAAIARTLAAVVPIFLSHGAYFEMFVADDR